MSVRLNSPTTLSSAHDGKRRLFMRRRVLVLMASVLTLTAIGSMVAVRADAKQVSNNYSTQWTDDEIVFISERIDDLSVHATLTLTLRRGGTVWLHVEAHNSGDRRKFVNYEASALSGGLRFEMNHAYKSRINEGKYAKYDESGYNFDLDTNWDRVRNDRGITAFLKIESFRVNIG
jgi:hypothetical protein